MIGKAVFASVLLAVALTVSAEVTSTSDTHFVLRHEANSTLSTEALWQRLIHPETWWHPQHTYSGRSDNLALSAVAGGLWREDWSGGSVQHGRVLLVQTGSVLRLEAPFGPLQDVGAYVVWTISIEPSDSGGSVVVFDERAIAPPGSALDKLASAVDGVKQQAIERLVGASAVE